jgi:hypothetical protein
MLLDRSEPVDSGTALEIHRLEQRIAAIEQRLDGWPPIPNPNHPQEGDVLRWFNREGFTRYEHGRWVMYDKNHRRVDWPRYEET